MEKELIYLRMESDMKENCLKVKNREKAVIITLMVISILDYGTITEKMV